MNRYLRCYAEISLEAIGHNIREVKKRLPEGVKLLGVVKANAYGHGAVPVASYLENQVDYFATATIEEAVELSPAKASRASAYGPSQKQMPRSCASSHGSAAATTSALTAN